MSTRSKKVKGNSSKLFYYMDYDISFSIIRTIIVAS